MGSQNLLGAALMAAGMLGATIADSILKFIGTLQPPEQSLWMAGVTGTVLGAILVRAGGARLLDRRQFSAAMGLRTLGETLATAAIMVALTMTTLSLFSAIIMSVPILVTFAAAIFFGERVGPRRWLAIFVGFAGVLVMIRPEGGEGSVALGALMSLLAATGMAIRDLASRRLEPGVTSMQATFWGYPALLALGLVTATLAGGPILPSWQVAGLMLLFTAAMITAIFTITLSMRMGEVSMIAPMRYSRLIFAFVLAWVLFDEVPDATTLIGAAIVVASGLVIFWREARTGRHRPAA